MRPNREGVPFRVRFRLNNSRVHLAPLLVSMMASCAFCQVRVATLESVPASTPWREEDSVAVGGLIHCSRRAATLAKINFLVRQKTLRIDSGGAPGAGGGDEKLDDRYGRRNRRRQRLPGNIRGRALARDDVTVLIHVHDALE